MNQLRERRMAEERAKTAVNGQDWPMAAYHLFNASRVTLRMAHEANGTTRESLFRLAKRYETRGDQALTLNGAKSDAGEKVTSGAKDGAPADERSWLVAERPTTRLVDVAGMDEMKEVIQTHVVMAARHKDMYAKYRVQPGCGVLMYGPPGTGKTFVARAIAGEVDAAFIPVEMRRVLSKWFGETEQLLAELFEAARKHPRSIIFFDEAEALFPKRSNTNSSVMARVVPQLLQLINGLDPAKNTIILLGATNRPWLMDEAATRPERFGRLVYVGPPDAPAREQMIRHTLDDTPVEAIDYPELARLTDGYSGADIAAERDSVCTEAKLAALKRTVRRIEAAPDDDTEPDPVTMDDFAAALQRVRPSICESDLRKFEAFRREFGRG